MRSAFFSPSRRTLILYVLDDPILFVAVRSSDLSMYSNLKCEIHGPFLVSQISIVPSP